MIRGKSISAASYGSLNLRVRSSNYDSEYNGFGASNSKPRETTNNAIENSLVVYIITLTEVQDHTPHDYTQLSIFMTPENTLGPYSG